MFHLQVTKTSLWCSEEYMSRFTSSRLPVALICGMLFVISGCRSQQEKQQVALEQAVNSMNEAIDRFIDDKDHSPRSLQELIVAGYLKEIPVDPVTRSSKTWLCLADDENPDDGILDVVSGSDPPDNDEGTYKSCP